jgi:hypothetical protein
MTTSSGPVEGYQQVAPTVTREGDVTTIDSYGVYYRQLNEAVRDAFAAGAKTVRILNVNGQRYIGTAVSGRTCASRSRAFPVATWRCSWTARRSSRPATRRTAWRTP